MSAGNTAKISKRVEKELHQTKVVIRRLPPDFTEEKFLDTVNPLPSNSYFYFAPGDPSLGSNGCCRAYIAFDFEAEILPFRNLYDGLVLESEKGTKYRMTVEYAPYQSVPKKSKKKLDTRAGTIEQDADFKAFLDAYEATEEPTSALDLVVYLQHLEATKPKEIQSTPLTEYLDKRGSRAKRGRATDPKKKNKGESKSKSKGSREEGKSSKFTDENSRDLKRKDRGKRDKASEPPRLVTKDKKADEVPNKSSTQWSTIEPSTSAENSKVKDMKKLSGRSDSGDRRSRDDRGESRTKNRDRPDKAIYTPRRQSHDDFPRSGDSSAGKPRDDGAKSSYQGRSQRYRGRREEGEYRQRDDKQSGRSRDRGKGPRDRQKRTEFRNES